MKTTRRQMLGSLGALGGTLAVGSRLEAQGRAGERGRSERIKPPRLRPGDTVGLVNPATAAFETMPIEILEEAIAALGLRVKKGEHYFDRRGYFAGADEARASDLNAFFADPEVRAVWARGGWGSARVLPHLDFESIRRNPKCVLGYSDVTALLLGVHAKTGLVTFHAPWPRRRFSAEHLAAVLMRAETPVLANPVHESEELLVQVEDRIQTITPGTARGRILGGNLTVLTAIVGSGYLPDWSDCILFLEDVNEAVYRVDRMLTQLKLAGVLDQIRGFVFGRCTDCDSGNAFGSLTLEEVLHDHIEPLGVPAWRGAMIGHIPDQFTIPLGIEVEIDAERGTIRLLEAAVS